MASTPPSSAHHTRGILLTHALLCTPTGADAAGFAVLPDHALFISGDTVAEIGPSADLAARHTSCDVVVDCRGCVVMPGLVCAHGHFYGAFSRGLDLGASPSGFLEILQHLWWRLDNALRTPAAVRVSAQLCLAAAVRAGTTTIIDHHSSPLFAAGSLDAIADATTAAGVRACLCFEVSDRNGADAARAGIAENTRFLRRCRDAPDALLSGAFGLHAAFTLSDATLDACAAAAREFPDAGFHVHVAEGVADEEVARLRFGTSTVARLHAHGILGPRTLVGHGVYISDAEIDLLAETGTALVTNPQSNMNNAVGLPRVAEMARRGVLVGLGTDGITYDMFAEYKANYFAHKHNSRDPQAMGADGFRILANNNAAIASRHFARPVGRLEPGCFADIVITDYDPPTPLTAGNMPWHTTFGMGAQDVRTVIAGGRFLVRDRQSLTIDAAAVAAEARELVPEIWELFKNQPVLKPWIE